MDGLRSFITKWQNEINLTWKVIIALLVVVFGGINIFKALKAGGSNKMKDILTHLMYAAIIIVIGIASWSGFEKIVKSIAPSGLPG